MSDPPRSKRERVGKSLSELKHTVKHAVNRIFRPGTPEPSTQASLAPVTSHPIDTTERSENDTTATSSTPNRGPAPPVIDSQKDLSQATVKERVVSVAKYSAGSIPGLGLVLDTLSELLESVPAAARNHAEYEQLRSSISASVVHLQGFLRTSGFADMSDTIADAVRELSKQAEEIGERQRPSTLSSYHAADADIGDLIWRYRTAQDVLRRLQVHASLSTWRATNESLKLAKENMDIAYEMRNETRMKKLNPALSAKYDSHTSSHVHRTGCTPGTRQQILQQLADWAQDPHGSKIYWMNGMAGTGKTTIAYSLCKQLKAAKQLAASFFCSRSLPDCRDVSRIAPTVAYQLAQCSWSYQETLCGVLGDEPDVAQSDIKTQWDTLVAKPLTQIKQELPSGLLVVVIDALDECSDHRDASRVLSSLLDMTAELPVKYFVTCRPDGASLDMIGGMGGVCQELYHLHNVEDSLVQADIHMYLTDKLSAHISPDQIAQLATRAGRLFIYAATVVRYAALDNRAADHAQRLRTLLAPPTATPNKVHTELTELYTTILLSALDANDLEQDEKAVMKLVLDTVICAREPLTMEGLVGLLSLKSIGQARRAIEPLRSVLYVDELSELVTVLHASFVDYMLSAERAKSFVCHERHHSQLLAQRCFDVMRSLLHFNMAQLASSFALDEHIPDLPDRLQASIPAHLAYACRSWSAHVVKSEGKDKGDVARWVDDMLRTKAMYWLEAMNLMSGTSHAARMLSDTYSWLMTEREVEAGVVSLCQDAYSFAAVIGASQVRLSTPHIYVSTLALWDKRRPMWTHYGSQLQGHVKVHGPAVDNRPSAGLAVWKVGSAVNSVSISPNGQRLATGSGDGRVQVWDASNGTLVVSAATIHNDGSYSVAFSPDGTRVASGSDDGTLRMWDAMTGAAIGNPWVVNTDTVDSVDADTVDSVDSDCCAVYGATS